ncbi:unnamed protein product [Rhizopus microsporus]
MSDKEQTQQLIALANNCFLCPEADFTTPQNLRKHLMNVHQLQLPGRPMGVKHRDTADIVYLAISNLMNSKVSMNKKTKIYCFMLDNIYRTVSSLSTETMPEFSLCS